METIQRLTHRLLPIPFTRKCLKPYSKAPFHTRPILGFQRTTKPIFRPDDSHIEPISSSNLSFVRSRGSSPATARAGWFLGMGEKKQTLPDIVQAGDPVLHEAAREVAPDEVGSERIQKIIDDMVKVMRKAPGVGLAAPQIGIPFKIIVLEDTKEYISYASPKEIKVQDRRPFDLLVIINPKLKKKGDKTALFFEGCLSVDGFRAVVERHLEPWRLRSRVWIKLGNQSRWMLQVGRPGYYSMSMTT